MSQRPTWPVWHAALAAVALSLVGCPAPAPAPTGDAGAFSFDSVVAKPDVTKPADAAGGDAAGSDAVAADTGTVPGTSVSSVAADVTPTLAVASKASLALTVTRTTGTNGAPSAAEKVTVKIDGKIWDLGTQLAPLGEQQPAVVVWKGPDAGHLWLAGVRPGTAEVAVLVDGVASAPATIEVAMPTLPGLHVVVPVAQGFSSGARTKDTSDDTIRLEGKSIGAGGLTITVRFPVAAKAGDVFDLEKASPVGGNLQVFATLADMGGVKLTVPKGRIFIDQVDKGWFKGTLVGTAANLTPLAGAFAVARDGGYGVDLLDDAQQTEASTTQKYTDTGKHVSRLSLSAVGGGKVLATWRHVEDVLKGSMETAIIDAATGQWLQGQALVPLAHAKVAVDDGQGGTKEKPLGDFVGWSSAATSNDMRALVWEGKALKGTAPYQISAVKLDANLAPTGPVLQVSADGCWGQCRPMLVPLPSTRWLAVWAAPGGGVKAAILDGNAFDQVEKTATLAPSPWSLPSVSSFDATLGVAWRDPKLGSQYKLYSDTLSGIGPEQSLGTKVAGAQGPAMVAMSAPLAFMALYFDPPNLLKARRINAETAAFATGSATDVDDNVVRVLAVVGKAGQIALVERRAVLAEEPQLWVRKLSLGSPTDGGTLLGPAVALEGSVSAVPLEPTVCYVPEADTFVVGWSGDVASDGVWIQRFR